MPYRRASDADSWHWCKNCTQWPEYGYKEVTEKPAAGLCSECKAKDEAGMCKRK